MRRNESEPLRVAVSGFDGLDNPHPGIGVARALRQGWGGAVHITALGYEPLMTGAWMPGIADALCIMPAPANGDEATYERLMEIHKDHPLDIVIPCLDLDVPVYARLADRLEHGGIRTLLPPPDSLYATSKLRLPKFCHGHHIPAPRTIHVLDVGDIGLHADQFGYPLIVKGVVAGARMVFSAAEAATEAVRLNRKWGGGVLLQDVVTGEEFVVAAVAGRDGGCLGFVPMRKLGVNENGKGVVGTVVDDPELERDARRILSCANWHGPLEMEFIRPLGAKHPQLIEMNCRFPSWIMLTHWAETNLPVLLAKEVLHPGRNPAQRARAGTTFVRDVEETTVALAELRALDRLGRCKGIPVANAARRAREGDGPTVAVTGVGTLDVVNAGLGVARALRCAPGIGRLYGMGYGIFDSGLYRHDVFDAGFRLPDMDDAGALLDRLRAIHGETPFDLILPCLDGEIPRFMEIRGDLEAMGVRTLLPSPRAFERRAKATLFASAEDGDWDKFSVPATTHVRSDSEAVEAARTLGFPVVLKGPVSYAIRAENESQTRVAWRILRKKGCEEALVQPFVVGDRFAVAAVCDRAHDVLSAMTIKKLRTCARGSTWSAIQVTQPDLEADFAKYLRAIAWVGPVEGEFIRDDISERFFLIEVNPRFTAWISFSAHTGLDHPYLAVCTALNRPVARTRRVEDRIFMRSCADMRVNPGAFATIATKGVLHHG